MPDHIRSLSEFEPDPNRPRARCVRSAGGVPLRAADEDLRSTKPSHLRRYRVNSWTVIHRKRETVSMKNITVSIDDDTYRLSRIKAAESGTSVSALVRAYLVGLAQDHTPETEFDRLRRLQDETLEAIRARGGGVRAADNLPRRALHDRVALRCIVERGAADTGRGCQDGASTPWSRRFRHASH